MATKSDSVAATKLPVGFAAADFSAKTGGSFVAAKSIVDICMVENCPLRAAAKLKFSVGVSKCMPQCSNDTLQLQLSNCGSDRERMTLLSPLGGSVTHELLQRAKLASAFVGYMFFLAAQFL